MKRARFFLSAALFFIFLSSGSLWAASLRVETKDKDQDGKPDQWLTYNAKGKLLQKTTDTNKDGKPDQFHSPLQGGREFVMKEYDRNFDGKIDRRLLVRWDANKSIPFVNGDRIQRLPNPGYATVWKEEDNNYDGVIDVYQEKKNKADKEGASKTKVGQSIETGPVRITEKAEASENRENKGGMSVSADEARMEDKNEKYGYE